MFDLLQAFTYYHSEVVEPSFKGLAHVGHMGEEEEARGEEGSPHQEGLEAIGQDKANKGTKETNPRLKSKGDAGPSSEKGRVPGESHDWHCGISQDGLKPLKSKCG